MSDGMNADQIARVFESLGRIEQKIDGHVDTVKAHIAHDEVVQKAIFERVEVLQAAHAKQRGFLSAISMVVSLIGAGIGYLVERWITHH